MMKNLMKLKKELVDNKEIRDYFLDRPYEKKSSLRIIGRRLKNMIFGWTKKELKVMLGFAGISFFISGLSYLLIKFLDVDNVVFYAMGSVILLFSVPLIYNLFSKKENDFEDFVFSFFFLMIPIGSGFFNVNYYLTGGMTSLVFSLLFNLLVLFPLPMTIIGLCISLVRNIKRVLFNERGRNDVWKNISMEDHEFLSNHLDEDEFCLLLKNIKIYDDLPLYEMESVRKKEEKENIKRINEHNKKMIDDEKNKKIEDYAKTFYK